MLLFLTLYPRSKIIVVNKSLYRVSQKQVVCVFIVWFAIFFPLLANLDRGEMFTTDETKK
jgi:hypothetical protein